jgi:hypothetical protein
MNNFNYGLDQLERQILEILSQSGMPVGVLSLLLNKLNQDVQRTYAAQVQLEAQAALAQQQNEQAAAAAAEPDPVELRGFQVEEVEEAE